MPEEAEVINEGKVLVRIITVDLVSLVHVIFPFDEKKLYRSLSN